ncbi:MAG: hypothetical protein HDQ95_14045 [Roseburia sp.]|nr:hypothetical protein [Roseburia sp.]
MVFWIFAILTVLAIIFLVIFNKIEETYDEKNKYKNTKFAQFVWLNEDVLQIVSGVTALISGFVAVLMLCAIIILQISANAERAAKEQQYQALVYKAQTESIRDEFGIINKEYIDEIQTWNQELAKCQSYSHNFWIGIFYPKRIYDGLEFIDWESIRMRQ